MMLIHDHEKDGGYRVAFMTVQYDRVGSGPGTFTRYMRQACRGGRLDLTFFSDDMERPLHVFERKIAHASLPNIAGRLLLRSYRFDAAFKALHKKHPFDLLWYNTAPANGLFSAMRKPDVPVVLMLSDYTNAISRYPLVTRKQFGAWRSVTRSIWRVFERQALRACDAVVVNSHFMKRSIARWYGLPEEKIFVLYKAVDVGRFAYQPPRAVASPLRVLFLKSDYRRGSLSVLLEALGNLPLETTLTVAGPPEAEHAALRRLAKHAGYDEPMRLCGRVSREEVQELYREHDVLCVPSNTEALGVVFLEALASGVPAIGGNVGGVPEVLDDGRAGWLVEPGSASDVRQALLEVAHRPDVRTQKVQHGRTHAETFSVDRMVDRFQQIAEDVVQACSRRGDDATVHSGS